MMYSYIKSTSMQFYVEINDKKKMEKNYFFI